VARQPGTLRDVSETPRPLADYWPIFGLRLATPRLVLTPLQDSDLPEMCELILAGIHDKAVMPFKVPWTDAPPGELIPNALRFHWSARADSTPERWSVMFMVRRKGVLVGLQELSGTHFAVTRTVSTGSWLGQPHQGQGIGTEMRSAVLQFAFDHLRAERADTGAFLDNPQSLAVSRKLGYRPDGTAVLQRRPGERAVEQRMTVERATFVRPDWMVQFRGLAACLPYFGL
jgi:RimJ/RimL family protein N-acetyltransferase